MYIIIFVNSIRNHIQGNRNFWSADNRPVNPVTSGPDRLYDENT